MNRFKTGDRVVTLIAAPKHGLRQWSAHTVETAMGAVSGLGPDCDQLVRLVGLEGWWGSYRFVDDRRAVLDV